MGKDFTSAKGDDNVYTPYSMTEQLLENEKFDYYKSVLEPACGAGAILKVINKKFDLVCNSDINCGIGGDFLKYGDRFNKYAPEQCVKYIITNPPYSKLDPFITKAKQVATEKFAFLCKITHLGGVDRFELKLFRDPDYPLTKIYMFTRQANLRFYDQEKEIKKLKTLYPDWSQGYKFGLEKIQKQTHYPELREDGKYPAGAYYFAWFIFENISKIDKHSDDYDRFIDSANFPVFKWINNDKYILRKSDCN
jgi:hypothetical protein